MAQAADTIHLIALRTVRYSDRQSFLSAYTLERGRMSFVVPAGSSREAARRRALLMPLSLIECKTDTRADIDIHHMHDVQPTVPLHGIHSHPVKASVAMFVADVLGHALRESQPDEALYAFLVDTVTTLNDVDAHGIASFHIAFLRLLTRYLGIEPDLSGYTSGALFSMTEGRYRALPSLRRGGIPSSEAAGAWLDAAESAMVNLLGRIDYTNFQRLRLDRNERNLVTDRLLQYFSIHLVPMGSLTTLPILRSL